MVMSKKRYHEFVEQQLELEHLVWYHTSYSLLHEQSIDKWNSKLQTIKVS